MNARPMTSIIGIARVMKEKIGELIVRLRFGELPEMVHLEGKSIFRKGDLALMA